MTFAYKRALIVGGSSGVGRALALGLAKQACDVLAIARGGEKLKTLQAEEPNIQIRAADASEDGFAEAVLTAHRPDLVVLAGGLTPRAQDLRETSWKDFSAPWNTDTKITFDFTRAALNLPLADGAVIINFSSGASLNGSRLSGGYAGAKRMQTFLAMYGQQEAGKLGLGLTFLSVIPLQLIAGTDIGGTMSSAYAKGAGITQEAFMGRWEQPLTPDAASGYLMELLGRPLQDGDQVFGLKGTGLEKLG